MKTRIMLLVIVSGLLSAKLEAATDTGDLPATVVGVGSRLTPSNSIYAGGSPSALALQPGKGARLTVLQPAHSRGLKESKQREQL